nr:NAD(P)-binding protein [Angustibacter aerolatus]
MSSERFDVVVVGGGHNGLTAAAYLARAGRSVLVLERLDHVGGAAVSARAFDGVDARLSRYAYLVSLLPRLVVDEPGPAAAAGAAALLVVHAGAGRPRSRAARRRRRRVGHRGVVRAGRRGRRRRGLAPAAGDHRCAGQGAVADGDRAAAVGRRGARAGRGRRVARARRAPPR